VPASGTINFNKNQITPTVYVRGTDSLVQESSCGSGSLAYSMFSGINKIKQPSDKIIEVKRYRKYFTIKVPVKIVK
jgi:hypothetical protein